jgi:AsmA protein
LKTFKIIVWLAGGLVVLAVTAVAIFAATFDPNRYKDDIERIVRERTGRTLKLAGKLEMAFYPSLGAKVAGVTLSERAADRAFLSLESAHASVALLPLLRGDLIVDRVRVSGLKAQIVKNQDGSYNFSDLLEPEGKRPAAGPGPRAEKARPVKFDIAAVQVERSGVTYRDLGSGQEWALGDFKLSTGRVAQNAEGKLEFATVAKRRAPPLEVKIALDGKYRLQGGVLKADLAGKVDESTLKAKLSAGKPQEFDFSIDRLNLDRYLAQEESGKPVARKPEPANEDTPIDLSGLKDLNAKGRLTIGALQARGLKLANVKTEIRAAEGRVEMGPHSADLYGGTLAGTLVLHASNRIALKEALSGVSVGPLLGDVAQQDRLEGKGSLALDVSGAGASVNAIKRSLAGSAKLQLRDGAIKGINIAEVLRKARTALGSQSAQATDQADRTDFSALSAGFAIKNGVAHNEDLEIKAPLFRVTGAGDIDLGRSSINYVAKALLVATAKGQGGADRSELAGLTIPVRLSGPLDAMKYDVDYRAVAGDLAKSKVKEKLEERIGERLKGLLRR